MSTEPLSCSFNPIHHGHTICILPIPTGTQPDHVTWGTDRHITEVRDVHQDSLGRYYIYIPHMDDPCYLGIHYTKS